MPPIVVYMFRGKRQATVVLGSHQLPSVLINRLDVSLPNNTVFSLPVFPEFTGSVLIKQIESYGIENYVICRNPPRDYNYWDILYVSNNDEIIKKFIKFEQPFNTSKLLDFFIKTKYIQTQNQIMPIFVFNISDFMNEMEIIFLSLKHTNVIKCIKPKPKIRIRVKLPTGLILPLDILPTKKVKNICSKLHKKMIEIYGAHNIRPSNKYIFGTINNYFPEVISIKISDDKILKEALRNQKIRPKETFFIYIQKQSKSKFHRITQNYVKDLELSTFPNDEEINGLNSSLSKLRSKIETDRIAKLQVNPLLARMRISNVDPVLPEKKKSVVLNIKTELRSSGINEKTTGVSFRISVNKSANDAIKKVFESMITKLLRPSHQKIRKDSETGTGDLRRSRKAICRNSDVSCDSFNDNESFPSNMTIASSVKPPSLFKTDEDLGFAEESSSYQTPQTISSDNESMINATSVPKFNENSSAPSCFVDGNFVFEDKSWNPNDYVLVVQGMDEVISGETLLYDFVYIRHFLLSSTQIMNTLLETKQSIIKSVQEKELNPSEAPEPKEENLTKIIECNTIVETNFDHMPSFPHTLTKEFLTINIQYCHNISLKKTAELHVKVCLINGIKTLFEPMSTRFAYGESTALFNDMITIPVPLNMIPRTARLSFTVYYSCISKDQKVRECVALATYNFSVFTFSGWLNSGNFTKKMWSNNDMDFLMTTCESNEDSPIIIHFSLPKYHFPLSFVEKPPLNHLDDSKIMKITENERKRLEELSTIDPLVELDESDILLIKKNRFNLPHFTQLQLQFLASVNYMNNEEVSEIPFLLKMWERPSPAQALSLLDAKYPDRVIREFAVECLDEFTDNDIMLYLLQLIQVLKYELYDDSALARFLLRRGLREPKFLGHQIFWQLMSEAHISHIRQRFSAYLINFLYGIGVYRDEFLAGYKFTKDLVLINEDIKDKEKNKIMEGQESIDYFINQLKNIKIPKEFHLPMDPRLVVDSFIVEKCKIMNSKKRPFMLVFKNADPFATEPIVIIFKCGDDLRQDQLCLQIMKVMEHFWIENGLDLQMRCYGVLPTGKDQGFIEVVQNSQTESCIQMEKGKIIGATSKDIFIDYLKNYNHGDSFKKALKNFRLSSAGYAVSTCVLGVADRHPDNVMIQQDGHFFHIDFGHFLGNFKSKYGYQRENAPFHFSLAIEACIGQPNSPEYNKFEQDCIKALNILRHNANVLFTLLILMLGTDIPELQKIDDILYFKKMLFLDMTDEQAAAEFVKLIKKSKDSTKTTINNIIHNVNR